MISTIRCCKNCVERTAGCHSRCELYQKEKGEFESMKEAERKVKNKRFNPFYQYKYQR